MSKPLIIGIDPGVTTGLAIWDRHAQALTAVTSTTILRAITMVREWVIEGHVHLVVMEDARLRTWFGEKGREALQGAGSIKRDCAIWAECLDGVGVPYKAVKPQAGATKWTAELFQRTTGWQGRTNEHARDAAMLVWGTR